MQTKAMQSAAPVLEAPASSLQPQPIDIVATLTEAKQRADRWLDQRSEWYSRIGEFPVTRRLALRINLVTACVVLTALAIEAAPFAAITSLATAMWLTYRFNHNADANKMVKKGGRS